MDPGFRVFASSRNIDTMSSLKDLNIELLPLDITETASILEAKAIISERTGGSLDVLVNNA